MLSLVPGNSTRPPREEPGLFSLHLHAEPLLDLLSKRLRQFDREDAAALPKDDVLPGGARQLVDGIDGP